MILDREPKIKTAPTTTEEEETVTIVDFPYTSKLHYTHRQDSFMISIFR